MRRRDLIGIAVMVLMGSTPAFAKHEGDHHGPSDQAYEHANEHAAFKRATRPGKSDEDAAQTAKKAAEDEKHAAKRAAEEQQRKTKREAEEAKRRVKRDAHKTARSTKRAAHEAKQAGSATPSTISH